MMAVVVVVMGCSAGDDDDDEDNDDDDYDDDDDGDDEEGDGAGADGGAGYCHGNGNGDGASDDEIENWQLHCRYPWTGSLAVRGTNGTEGEAHLYELFHLLAELFLAASTAAEGLLHPLQYLRTCLCVLL